MSPESSIRNQNETGWDREINEFTLAKRFANQALHDAVMKTESFSPTGTMEHSVFLAKTQLKSDEDINNFKKIYEKNPSFEQSLNSAATLISSNHQSLNSLFNKTFRNLAIRSYREYNEKAPTIVVENIWEGLGFSTAEDMRKLLDKSRAGFEEYLVNNGKSENEAKKIAEKQLGVTWDMGHINMAKGKGFDDSYVEEETRKIAEYVKHVHVTDNFGFEDSHLIPGMGNVPIKKVLEQLEKAGKIDEMKMIVEAGGINSAFKRLPHQMSLGSFNAGLGGIASGQGGEMIGNYFGGYGTVSPEQHHNMYGAGFTTMPVELGGQMSGGQSRFGGTPMA
jgi:hypothetical protein